MSDIAKSTQTLLSPPSGPTDSMAPSAPTGSTSSSWGGAFTACLMRPVMEGLAELEVPVGDDAVFDVVGDIGSFTL
jgi:hypothetical protein